MNKQKKGFTLVELLVVIAIIAILAGALMLAINPVALRQKANDTRRLADLDTLSKGMLIALTESDITLGITADPGDSATGTRAVDGTGWVSFTVPLGKTGLAGKFATLPIDPVNTGLNVYSFASTVAAYEFNAVLEHADNLTKMTTDGGDNAAAYEMGTSLTIMN